MNRYFATELAGKWCDAYRGDYNGREVSIELITALIDFGFTEWEAEQVYRSKFLRWFFDSEDDHVFKHSAHGLFTKFLTKNLENIREMFKTEFNIPGIDYYHLTIPAKDS